MTDYSLYKKLRFRLWSIGIGTNRPQSKVDISGNVQVLGHVTPSVSLNYDLGSTTKRWRDIYLSGNTIDLGGTLISKEANGGIKIADNLGNTLDGKFNNLVINGAINQVTRLDVSGSILPTRNLVYDLGAPDKRWNDLYLSGNTIDLSGTLLSRHTDGSLMVHDSNNNMITGRFADVTATGNIGVGTDKPLYKMHVIGNTRIQGNLMVNGTTTVVDTNVNTTEMLEITNDGTGPALRVTQTGVQPIADFCDDASNNVVVRIADSGNVGIGTLTPQTKLHVMGNVKVNGDVSANNFYGKLKWTDVSGAPPYELPVGSVVVYDGIAQLDSSFVPADGQTLNRADYPELANALNIPGNQLTFTVPTSSEYQVNWNDISSNSVSYIRNKPNVYGDVSGNVDVSGNIKLKDGSVSSPVLTFSSDLNTGFYRAGNDILGFVTGGSERMRIDANGNIGIGTNNPQAKLDVNGSGLFYGGTTGLRVNGIVEPGIRLSNSNYVNWDIFSGGGGSSDYNNSLTFYRRTGTSGNVIFQHGNVGIGTSIPQTKLQIANIGLNTKIRVSASDIALNSQSGIELGLGDVDAGYDPAWSIYANGDYNYGTGRLVVSGRPNGSGTVTTERMTILANGNVGIGITNPTAKLHVNGSIITNTFFCVHYRLIAKSVQFSEYYIIKDSNFTLQTTPQSLMGFNASNLINKTIGSFIFPIKGLYTVCFGVRFETGGMNAAWLYPYNGYGVSNTINSNIRLGASEGTNFVQCNISFTGIWDINESIVPVVWSTIVPQYATNLYGGTHFTVTLLQIIY